MVLHTDQPAAREAGDAYSKETMPANDELIRALSVALEASPDNVPLRKHLAEILVGDHRLADAEREYRRALDFAPNDDTLKLGLADVYYQKHQADVAVVILEEIMRRPNPSSQVLLLAARAYLESGTQAEAAQAYDRAVALDATLADAELESRLVRGVPTSPESTPGRARDLVFVAAGDIGEPAAPFLEVERSQISFKDVGGMDKLKDEIRMKIIYPLTHPHLYRAYGKAVGGGILMYGPPGCGKTYLARATAGEVQAQFVAIGLDDVLDMWLGQSERNLHNVFDLARQHTPCVLFFDEVDALGANRADMRFSAGRQVISQFLSEMDGIDTCNSGVLILAATNAPWHLDPALRRPGRFDRIIFVPPPDAPTREAILRITLANRPTGKIDYRRLAQETPGFTGADLQGVVDRAIEIKLQEALRRGTPAPIVTQDLLIACKSARPSSREWFATARNWALYSNEGGIYDDVLDYLKQNEGGLSRL